LFFSPFLGCFLFIKLGRVSSWSNLGMCTFMITFTSCFRMGKGQGWQTFPKWKAQVGYYLVQKPLILGMPSP
jgi:hypothetical protein